MQNVTYSVKQKNVMPGFNIFMMSSQVKHFLLELKHGILDLCSYHIKTEVLMSSGFSCKSALYCPF